MNAGSVSLNWIGPVGIGIPIDDLTLEQLGQPGVYAWEFPVERYSKRGFYFGKADNIAIRLMQHISFTVSGQYTIWRHQDPHYRDGIEIRAIDIKDPSKIRCYFERFKGSPKYEAERFLDTAREIRIFFATCSAELNYDVDRILIDRSLELTESRPGDFFQTQTRHGTRRFDRVTRVINEGTGPVAETFGHEIDARD